jgi:hypothetical protein
VEGCNHVYDDTLDSMGKTRQHVSSDPTEGHYLGLDCTTSRWLETSGSRSRHLYRWVQEFRHPSADPPCFLHAFLEPNDSGAPVLCVRVYRNISTVYLCLVVCHFHSEVETMVRKRRMNRHRWMMMMIPHEEKKEIPDLGS